MGINYSKYNINFETLQQIIINKDNKNIIVNTLPSNEQSMLILNTLNYSNEENIINNAIKQNLKINIFIYGKNYNDETIYIKYKQLINLGFTNVYIYMGGLFEWLLLQDIYGNELFPTTSKELDFLKFKPSTNLYL